MMMPVSLIFSSRFAAVNPALPFANLLSKPNGNPDEKFIPSVAF
jgi:hypothetical protein